MSDSKKSVADRLEKLAKKAKWEPVAVAIRGLIPEALALEKLRKEIADDIDQFIAEIEEIIQS